MLVQAPIVEEEAKIVPIGGVRTRVAPPGGGDAACAAAAVVGDKRGALREVPFDRWREHLRQHRAVLVGVAFVTPREDTITQPGKSISCCRVHRATMSSSSSSRSSIGALTIACAGRS